MSLNYIKSIRLMELKFITNEINKSKHPGCKILEISADSEWQT